MLKDPRRRRTYDLHGAEAALEDDGSDMFDDDFVDDSGEMDWSYEHLEQLFSKCFKAMSKEEVQKRFEAANVNLKYEPDEAPSWTGSIVKAEIVKVRELGVSEIFWTRFVLNIHISFYSASFILCVCVCAGRR